MRMSLETMISRSDLTTKEQRRLLLRVGRWVVACSPNQYAILLQELLLLVDVLSMNTKSFSSDAVKTGRQDDQYGDGKEVQSHLRSC